jgi:hypothetical protein
MNVNVLKEALIHEVIYTFFLILHPTKEENSTINNGRQSIL